MPSGVYERQKFPEKVKNYVRSHASEDITIKQMTAMVNHDLKLSIPYDSIRGQYMRERLPKRNGKGNAILNYEQVRYLNEISPGRNASAVADMMNRQFGTSLTTVQIQNWKRNHTNADGTYQLRTTRYEPIVKELGGRNADGTYSPDHIGYNRLPAGSIVYRAGNGWMIKSHNVKGGNERNWEPLSRYMWQYIHGPIPPTHRLIFLDGDCFNCRLSNLRLVSRSEQVIAQLHIGMTDDADVNASILGLARLRSALIRKEKDDERKQA